MADPPSGMSSPGVLPMLLIVWGNFGLNPIPVVSFAAIPALSGVHRRMGRFGIGEGRMMVWTTGCILALGVADHIWDIGELIEAATDPSPRGRPVGWFWVIEVGIGR